MRISENFGLDRTQAQLDFVDVETNKDTPLFLDPHFLASRNDPWSSLATGTIQSFFSYFIGLLTNDMEDEARGLFDYLHEPNETCLGMSRGQPRGNGIGEGDADNIYDSLAESKAAQTGLLEHLEDCRLFVRGVDKDKISDMTTNIIRLQLIEYTQHQCELWGIPLRPDSPSGFYWNSTTRAWEQGYTSNLYIGDRRILLVPKGIVSFAKKYTPQRYHWHFVLNFLKHDHLRMNSALVQSKRRRDGSVKRWVTKQDLVERAGAICDKDYLAGFTKAHPEVFRKFKARPIRPEDSVPTESIFNEDIGAICEYLGERLRAIPAGRDHATEYHRTVFGILELLFYPRLITPLIEQEIHDGRKRIDITLDNGSSEGFFFNLSTHFQIPCGRILVECKNYTRDVHNPELDQMAGRFSPNRSKFGLVICRSVEDLDTLLTRCRDTHTDQRGTILPLTDNDLIAGLIQRASGEAYPLEGRLTEMLRILTM